ncbi:MAG: sugar phosphate isomerase/epimerase [Planctomycetaceae bacterium]
MSLRLAVATEDLHSSLQRAIGLAAGLQVPGIRLNARTEINVSHTTASALRQTLLYVKERHMRVAGLMCSTRHALYDPEFLEPRLDVIRRSMDVVRKLETSELVVRCGRIPDPDSVPSEKPTTVSIDEQANPFSFAPAVAPVAISAASQFSLLCELLNDLAQHGNHVGCTLNLQLSGYDLRLVRRLLSEVKSGPVGICFDPATAVMTGAPVARTYRDLYSNVGYVRARDALKDLDGAGVEVAVGDGTVDWCEFLPTLSEAEFAGWVCVERTGGDDRAADVARGVTVLKNLLISPEA